MSRLRSTFVVLVSTWCAPALASDIVILTPDILHGAIDVIGADYEKSSGDALKVHYGTAAPLKRAIDSGAQFDVAVLAPSMIDDLVIKKKIIEGTKADVLKTEVGLAINKNAPKAEINSRDTLKQFLLASKCVSYSSEGQSGRTALTIFERLGISSEMKEKALVATAPGEEVAFVADEKYDAAFSLTGLILRNEKVVLAGELPDDVRQQIVFTAGVSSESAAKESASKFLAYLQSEPIVQILKSKGLR